MRECFVCEDTLTEAYHAALTDLWYYGDTVDCTDYNTKCAECGMTMIVTDPLAEPRISKLIPATPYDLEKYRQEILDGILDFEIGRGWSYTYHDRLANYRVAGVRINQIKFVVRELKRNPNSRRAVIDVRHWTDVESNDPACLQHIQFFIRRGKLDCSVVFRSNDATEATFMNAFALICLQERIAKELHVEVGTYKHIANSFHCYEKDFDKLEKWVTRIERNDDLTYCYCGDWDELMKAERPAIKKFVKELKNEE